MPDRPRSRRPGLVAVAIASLLCIGSAQAALEARYLGGSNEVNAYYDTQSNLLWLKNTTMGTGDLYVIGSVPGVDENTGYMTWDGARFYASLLNQISYLGLSNWRMPQASLQDTGCSSSFYGYTLGTGCSSNEVIQLFGRNPDAKTVFQNVQQLDGNGYRTKFYWSANNGIASGFARSFDGLNGDRAAVTYAPYPIDQPFYDAQQGMAGSGSANTEYGFLWLVREGDVAAPIPEPGSAVLLGLGLGTLLMGSSWRRRKLDAGKSQAD